MAASGDRSSTITLKNGKTVKVNTNLDNGQGTLTDSQGRNVGTIGPGGKISFSGGDNNAQKELMGLSGSRSRFLNKELNAQVKPLAENENKAILQKNASNTQLLNLRDQGYSGIDPDNLPGNQSSNSQSAPKTNPQSQTSPNSDSPSTTQQPNSSFNQGNSASGEMRFPKIQVTNLDFVIFTGFEYAPLPAAGNAGGFGSGMLSRMSERLIDSSKKFSITLPIQQSVNDTNAVGWGEDKLNFVQAAAGGVLTEATKAIAGEGGAPGAVFDSVAQTASQAANDPNVKQFLATRVAKQAIGSDLFTRSTGMAANNNLTLLFQGPSLRGFAFQFTLTPKNKDESTEIKKIIRAFKQGMAPGVGAAGLFLQSPNIFKIDYRNSEGQPHPFLNRFKPLALTDMAVNYTPNNQYTTYEDSGMIQYQLNLTFKEIDPIFREDYDDGEGQRGMGF